MQFHVNQKLTFLLLLCNVCYHGSFGIMFCTDVLFVGQYALLLLFIFRS